jgi:hypothetical protein
VKREVCLAHSNEDWIDHPFQEHIPWGDFQVPRKNVGADGAVDAVGAAAVGVPVH